MKETNKAYERKSIWAIKTIATFLPNCQHKDTCNIVIQILLLHQLYGQHKNNEEVLFYFWTLESAVQSWCTKLFPYSALYFYIFSRHHNLTYPKQTVSTLTAHFRELGKFILRVRTAPSVILGASAIRRTRILFQFNMRFPYSFYEFFGDHCILLCIRWYFLSLHRLVIQ